MRWEDESIVFLLKTYKELYVTHINHNNLKNVSLVWIVNILNQFFYKTWTIINIQSKIDWCKKHHQSKHAKVVEVTEGVPLKWS